MKPCNDEMSRLISEVDRNIRGLGHDFSVRNEFQEGTQFHKLRLLRGVSLATVDELKERGMRR